MVCVRTVRYSSFGADAVNSETKFLINQKCESGVRFQKAVVVVIADCS